MVVVVVKHEKFDTDEPTGNEHMQTAQKRKRRDRSFTVACTQATTMSEKETATAISGSPLEGKQESIQKENERGVVGTATVTRKEQSTKRLLESETGSDETEPKRAKLHDESKDTEGVASVVSSATNNNDKDTTKPNESAVLENKATTQPSEQDQEKQADASTGEKTNVPHAASLNIFENEEVQGKPDDTLVSDGSGSTTRGRWRGESVTSRQIVFDMS